MAEKKIKEVKVKKSKKKELPPVYFKGYDIKWLKEFAGKEHPDFGLVDEYEKKFKIEV